MPATSATDSYRAQVGVEKPASCVVRVTVCREWPRRYNASMGTTGEHRAQRIYSYIVTHDSGYAPNPFRGYCTLACCKPAIRRTAKKGDWIVGITSKRRGVPQRMIYAMRVDEMLSFSEYWADPRFAAKKPVWSPHDRPTVASGGDNCYQPIGRGRYRQLRCRHSHRDGRPNTVKMRRDLSGERVLVSWTYAYFGEKPRELPKGIPIPQRNHRKVVVDTPAARTIVRRLARLNRGRHGRPQMLADSGVRCPKSRCG